MIVQTETAVYVINELDRLLHRYPRQSADCEQVVSHLRKDGEPIPYKHIGHLEVGKPAQFVLQIRDDGVETVRTTTHVTSISGA